MNLVSANGKFGRAREREREILFLYCIYLSESVTSFSRSHNSLFGCLSRSHFTLFASNGGGASRRNHSGSNQGKSKPRNSFYPVNMEVEIFFK